MVGNMAEGAEEAEGAGGHRFREPFRLALPGSALSALPAFSLPASASASNTARALASVSRHSAAGSESATMPAPAWIQARPSLMTHVRIAIAVSRLRAPHPT